MFHQITSLMLILLLLFSMSVSIAGGGSLQEGAIADVKHDTNKYNAYFSTLDNFLTSTIPTEHLMGKSPEYVSVYMNRHRKAETQKQQSASKGCTTACIVASIGCLVLGYMVVFEFEPYWF